MDGFRAVDSHADANNALVMGIGVVNAMGYKSCPWQLYGYLWIYNIDCIFFRTEVFN